MKPATPPFKATYAFAGPPEAHTSGGSATAVIVWHGMGQQIKFSTVELVVRALVKDQERRHGQEPPVTARLVQLGDQRVWRAEVPIAAADGSVHDAHVYEVYWAPLTQGKVSIKETILFLLNAGWQGIRHAGSGMFFRHLFGRWIGYPVDRWAVVEFVTLLLMLCSLIVMNLALATAASVSVVTGGGSRWPSYALLGDLTLDFALFEAFLGTLIVWLFLAFASQKERRRHAISGTRRPMVQALIWALAMLAVGVTIAAGGLVALHLVLHHDPTRAMWWARPRWLVDAVSHATRPEWPGLVAIGVIWLAAVIISAVVRYFLVEYVGDVAVYVSSYMLNRFYEVRQAIKAATAATTKAVYQFGGYSRHILVGHSLGSVVAYDTLNALLNEDALGGQLRVAPRTSLLVTFGSPLDKTAFLFRAQSEFSDVREALASAAQPLISDPGARPPWINIYSANDVISGALDYYDPGHGTEGSRPHERSPVRSGRRDAPSVVNIADADAWIPLVAHTQYWTNAALVDTLREAITGGEGRRA